MTTKNPTPAMSPASKSPVNEGARRSASAMLNKVPEVFLLFWVVKIFSTTVGETAADFLASNVGLGLTGTSLIMAGLTAVALAFQFRARRYVPAIYWACVVLISIMGTLITDNLVDNFGVSLWTTTFAFSAALAATFAAWFRSERTLSIHTILTSRREGFYWSAILLTFALGTSAGDLFGEKLALGYLPSAGLFGLLIALVTLAHLKGGLNAVLAFWTAYILTRPFGASVGDYLTQAPADGGLGLGANATSGLFLVVIVAAVAWFTSQQRKADALQTSAATEVVTA
ncbi:hypothetical protein [Nocardioides sp.]|jgi:uncharacterized membrane-anchored protein|uniref:COG4705 family protein n=1 Tax=Nocardioides sp. TaxID=35761 RepID=UPI002605AB12|nr:hypothetical protein [Nocardioides sp.]